MSQIVKSDSKDNMSVYQHILLSLKFGFYVGLFIGTIDVFARIVNWGFDWYEFYQALALSLVFVVPIYFFFGVFLELPRIIFRMGKKSIIRLYLTNTIFFIIFLYSYLILRVYVFHVPQFSYKTCLICSMLLAVIGTVLIGVTLKRSKLSIERILTNRTINAIRRKYAFFVVVFIVSSFTIDFATINHVPRHNVGYSSSAYPNIILISIDDMRGDALLPDLTPFLSKLAQSSAVFTNVKTVGPWTLTSHASMLTGMYPHHHRATWRHQSIDPQIKALTEMLPNEYNTAGFVAGQLIAGRFGFARFFDYYDDRLDLFQSSGYHDLSLTKLMKNKYVYHYISRWFGLDGTRNCDETNMKVLEWIGKNKQNPFFAFIHYSDVHGYMYAASRSTGRLARDENPEILRKYYNKQLLNIDQQINIFFSKLAEMNILNNTLLIMTSDHGEEFMEHGRVGRGKTLYEEIANVPLILYFPQGIRPQIKSELVSIVDIAPTILNILGVKGIVPQFDGQSLLPLLEGKKMNETPVYLEEYGRDKYKENTVFGVYEGSWKCVYVSPGNKDFSSALYNLEEDLHEKHNLINEESERYNAMLGYLDSLIKSINTQNN